MFYDSHYTSMDTNVRPTFAHIAITHGIIKNVRSIDKSTCMLNVLININFRLMLDEVGANDAPTIDIIPLISPESNLFD